jgi:hypothetical protein
MHKTRILKIVTSNPFLEIIRETGHDSIKLVKLYNELEDMLKTHIPYGEIGEKLRLLLALAAEGGETAEGINILEKDVFIPAIKAKLLDKGNILHIDCSGKVVKQIEGIIINDYSQAADFSRENQLIVFFIDFRTIHIIVSGRTIYYIDDILKYDRPGVRTQATLPAREYRRLIERQYADEVAEERGFKYWHNKPNRLFLDNPEILFHGPLWSYLDQYMIDGTPDKEASISGTANRTDIRITDFTNQARYIIEIKCLGRTFSSKVEKSDDWANYGLSQLNIYLKEEEKFTCQGTLVLYDGRRADKEINWCVGIDCHPSYDNDPMRFYLESESASVKAKKIVGNLKKQPRE